MGVQWGGELGKLLGTFAPRIELNLRKIGPRLSAKGSFHSSPFAHVGNYAFGGGGGTTDPGGKKDRRTSPLWPKSDSFPRVLKWFWVVFTTPRPTHIINPTSVPKILHIGLFLLSNL